MILYFTCFAVKEEFPKLGLDFFIKYYAGDKIQERLKRTKDVFDDSNDLSSACREQPQWLPVLGSENVSLGSGHNVLMVETSDRGRLTGRQACAVESAARRYFSRS